MKKKGILPKAIAGGMKRQQRKQTGGVAPAPTPRSIIRQLVPVRPVLPPPPSPVAAADRAVKTPPALSPGRLTAVRAIQSQRDKGRARAVEASPREALRAYGREAKSMHNAKVAFGQAMTRKNPASPQADMNTGRLRYSAAFGSSPFRAPFQKSWNSRRSFGG